MLLSLSGKQSLDLLHLHRGHGGVRVPRYDSHWDSVWNRNLCAGKSSFVNSTWFFTYLSALVSFLLLWHNLPVKRKDLFWLWISEVSIHAYLALWLWTGGETIFTGRVCAREEIAHLMAAGKQRQRKGRAEVPIFPLRAKHTITN